MRNKKLFVLLGLLLLAAAFSTGCGVKDSYTHLEDELLTPEALELFSALDGAHGVMVYQDASLFRRSEGRLYVVLYGASGQALSLESKRSELVLKISGAPLEGYSVWKVVYKRNVMGERQISFTQNGVAQTMDGLETLDFVVEQANVIR